MIAEIKDGDITNYIRGVTGIIYSKDKKGTKTYYVTNNHGDVTALVNSSGTIVKEYTYDEYGVEKNPDKEDTNPFRYCGEYYDTETGFIYLRARYYDPELGRFISEDPARSETNWYVYCSGNSVNAVDLLGLEKIVVSGSEYDGNLLDKRYKGNFLDPAINRLKGMVASAKERITWIVSKTGYSDEAIAAMKTFADGNGVNFITIDSADDLINYINSGSVSDKLISERRINDKITSFELYSHGLEFNGGTIELGYRQDNANSLSLNSNNIKRMNWRAFEGCTSKFYSCNTGKAGYNSFAQNWVNITGGKAIASKNKTTYVPVGYYLNSDQKNSIKYYGFNVFGSNYQPIPSGGGSWLTFTKIDGR